jgi:FkbH-like protein
MHMDDGSARVPADVGLAVHVAQYHLAHRNLGAAGDVLMPLLSPPPDSPTDRQSLAEALSNLALSYVGRREVGPAAEAVAHAQALAAHPPVWRAAAALAALQGDMASVVEFRRRVVDAEPDESASWLALARAYEAAQRVTDAAEACLQAARVAPTHATILSVGERLAALVPPQPGAAPDRAVRIALIGSSTLDHLRSYLEVWCRLAGLLPTFYLGPYGQYAQDILDPGSALYAFDPHVVIAVVHGRSLFPALYDTPFDLSPEERRAAAGEVIEHVAGLLAALTSHTHALILWHTFATPQFSPLGTLDLRDEFGQAAIFQTINAGLAERVRRDFPSLHLIDEDRVYGRIGKCNVTDPRLWFLARIGIAEGALGALATEYMRYIQPLRGRMRKCLVLDLDNTLWGGVVGEDGPYGIDLGHEAPGNAYLAFQQAILDLWKRGVLLAINSKNNAADALEVLEHHPDMLLRPHHFATIRINWLDKAENLRSIAEQLNIGLDSLVFLDDNPAECALVRARLPEVLTVNLPGDPAQYRRILLELTAFDTLNLTDEDRRRTQLYAQRQAREQWASQHVGSLEDHLAGLGLVVEISLADEFALPRVVQLIGKTNQFNLTTRRHDEATVRSFVASSAHGVYTARVRDRFGDQGLVGVAIIAIDQDVWELDTLLLSCRVLGCGVETAFLAALVDAACAWGARTLRGIYVPTAKNEPARDLYGRHGFHLTVEHDGTQQWELNILSDRIAAPAWLTLNSTCSIPALAGSASTQSSSSSS